jgi:predicted Zn-dependent protease
MNVLHALWAERLRALALLVLLPTFGITSSGCGRPVENLVTGERQRGAYTWAQEVQIGREADQQIRAQFGFYDDPALSAYVEQLGQEVLQTSAWGQPETPAEIRNTPFHFRVLDSGVVNAFALPGGYIYVTRGLLANMENEAQLAVVLGHEIGHVLARHSSRRAAQAQTGQLGLLGAAVLGGVVGGGRVAQGILDLGGTGVQLLFLSYSREDEREADRAGVAYAEFAGYDATEGAEFFRTLQRLGEQSGSGGLPSFLSTHPDPGERAQTIPQLAAQMDPRGTEVNRDGLLARVDGIVLGENPRQGYTEGNTFYHPDLRFRFSYPSGWRVNNAASAVQIAEPNGRAVMEFTFAADQNSAQAAGRAFAGQQGFTPTEQGATTVNGNPAYAVVGTAQTQQGQIAAVSYFIEHGGNVYRFSGLTAANNFGTYQNQFRSALTSFQSENRAEVLNRQPVRLEVVRAPSATTFRQLLQGRPIPQGMTQEEIAIMNGVNLTTQIPAGNRVKLPRG